MTKNIDRIKHLKTTYPKEFLEKQKELLISLRAAITDGIERPDGKVETADHLDTAAGTTDFDFALSILAADQNSLLEIQHALKRVEDGSYGMCEISGKTIPKERLEVLPFTRYTVENQSKIEKDSKFAQPKNGYQPLFEEEVDDEKEEDHGVDSDGPDV